MTLAGLAAEDEHCYMAHYLEFDGYHGEIDVLDDFITMQITSHIGLKDVAADINMAGAFQAVDWPAAP